MGNTFPTICCAGGIQMPLQGRLPFFLSGTDSRKVPTSLYPVWAEVQLRTKSTTPITPSIQICIQKNTASMQPQNVLPLKSQFSIKGGDHNFSQFCRLRQSLQPEIPERRAHKCMQRALQKAFSQRLENTANYRFVLTLASHSRRVPVKEQVEVFDLTSRRYSQG